MWTPITTRLRDGRGLHAVFGSGAATLTESGPASLTESGGALTYAEVLTLWCEDRSFRATFRSVLADAPYSAYRWETPPLTEATADRPFELVLIDDPPLARAPDPRAFAEHFARDDDDDGIVDFANLGGDAILVAPCPVADAGAYGHLAAFVRRAPERQCDALWQRVGSVMRQRLGTRAVWLNTAGDGISWLHVRLDDSPKYYAHRPYAHEPAPAPGHACSEKQEESS